jgi:hypothetical protein
LLYISSVCGANFQEKYLSIKFFARSIAASVFLSFLFLPSVAQQTPAQQSPPPANPAPATAPQSTSDKDKEKTAQGASVPDKNAGTSNDRLFYTLPNFLTLEKGGNVPPLTSKQKFQVVFRSSFDPVIYPWYGFLSAISQAENSEPGYGQGWAGYGKRYGAAFADGTIENFMTGAILPSLLHQDPRFFQLGTGSFMHRTAYAVSRSFITRTDSGHSQFNYSEIAGGGLSALISTYSYHPSADRTLSNTVSVWGSQLGYDTITIVVKEFWPDIHRKLSHKHGKSDALPADSKP